MSDYMFENAEEALKWSVEVLRRRRLVRTSMLGIAVAAEAEEVARAWEGTRNLTLPQDATERMGLALKVVEAMERVSARDSKSAGALQLWAWGDWADEGRLKSALAVQERMRREGVKVRIAYRYTYEQLGNVLGCDRKSAWRRVQEGLGLLGEELAQKGLVDVVEGPDGVSDDFKKNIYSSDFIN